MNKDNKSSGLAIDEDTYISRVLKHDALKKGTAAFIASAIFALASEALFPSSEP